MPKVCSFTADRANRRRPGISHGEVRWKFLADARVIGFRIKFVDTFIYHLIYMSSYHLVIFLLIFLLLFLLLFFLLWKHSVSWSPFMHSKFSKLLVTYSWVYESTSSVPLWGSVFNLPCKFVSVSEMTNLVILAASTFLFPFLLSIDILLPKRRFASYATLYTYINKSIYRCMVSTGLWF